MTHLSDAELVDAVEGALTPARRTHADSCGRCRAAVIRLGSVLREVSSADVPEPSPLFWDHFSARVRDAVAAEQPASSRWAWASLRAPWIQVVAFCAIVISVASAAWFVRPSDESKSVATVASTTPLLPSTVANPSEELTETDDPAWVVLSAAAADLTDQETPSATLTVRPAAVDMAVQQLTPQERQELRRLLQSEMKRSSD